MSSDYLQRDLFWTLWGSRTGQRWDLREPGTSFCPNRRFWGDFRWIYRRGGHQVDIWQQQGSGVFSQIQLNSFNRIWPKKCFFDGDRIQNARGRKIQHDEIHLCAKEVKRSGCTWLLVTSQRWQGPCRGTSSWSSPPRPSSSRRGAPPCTASGQVSNCVMEKSPKYTYFGLSKHSILRWDRWNGNSWVLIPATSWCWRWVGSGWRLCGSVGWLLVLAWASVSCEC